MAKEYAEYVVATAVAENDIDYVRKMLKKGYPIAEIAEISPLSLEEIEKIKAKMEIENHTKKSRYPKNHWKNSLPDISERVRSLKKGIRG